MSETSVSGLDKAKILRDQVNQIRAEEARRSTAVNEAYVEMLDATATYERALAELEGLDVPGKIRRLAFDALSDGVRPSWVAQVTGLSRSTVYRIKNEIEEAW